MKDTNSTYLDNTLKKLEAYSKRKQLINIALGFLKTVLVLILIFTLFVILEGMFNFSAGIRTGFFIFICLSSLILLSVFVLPFFIKYLRTCSTDEHYNLAMEIGNKFKDVKDELINSLQLLRSENKKTNYSPQLVESAFKQTYEKIKNVDFTSSLNLDKLKKQNRLTMGAFIICFLFVFLFPGIPGAFSRVINFTKDYTPPQLFTLNVSPGDKQITKSDDVEISVTVNGKKPKKIFLATKNPEQLEFKFKQLKPDTSGKYNLIIKSVLSSFNYYAVSGEIKSKIYSIKVLNRPLIKNLNVKIIPPGYAKQTATLQKDNGNITALKGSLIDLKIKSTKALASTVINFNSGKEIKMTPKGETAEVKFRIMKNDKYRILITDNENIKNKFPIEYEINTLQDEMPEINLLTPVKDVSLSIDNRLPISVQLNDDFGFSALKIKYTVNSNDTYDIKNKETDIDLLFNKKLNNLEVDYLWNMIDINLTSNDVLSFFVEVFDNDKVSGPKSARTKTINVRIPSLDELLAGTNNTYNKSVNNLKETLKKAEELQKELQKLSQNMKRKEKKINWKEENKLKQSTEKFKDLQKKALKTAEDLKKMREQLQKNNLLSPKTMEKYLELQKLMDSLSSEEMKKAFEQMQNMLSSMDRKKLQDALKNFKFNEEQFRSSLERTLNLLKRIKVSQKIDELLTRTKDIAKKEKEIIQKTSKNNTTENKQLSNKQNRVSKSLESLKKELKNLEQLMKELSDMPKESLDSLKNEFNKQKNKELSERISKQLQKNKNQDALKMQNQLSNNMKKMQSMVSQLQKEIQQKNQMETFVEMMKSLDDLISLSKEEENLLNNTPKNNNISSLKKKAEKQNQVMRSLSKVMQQLGKLSQKTFAITPEMGKALGDAMRYMSEAITGLQNYNGYLSANKQLQAMGSLNDAASLLKSSLEIMMKGGGQGGMMSLMQQLGQMAQQQMNLNNLTKGLQHNGKFSQQQLAQLKRLQQQQDLIKKSLHQLNDEAKTTGKSKTLAADLDEILKQMQEVITNMQNKNVDDNLIQTQERILSKLLDAQRSVNERDYEKRRESLTGKNIFRKSPGQLNLNDKKINTLRDELIKAINEGYSKDYEDLIKKYFEQLEKVKEQK